MIFKIVLYQLVVALFMFLFQGQSRNGVPALGLEVQTLRADDLTIALGTPIGLVIPALKINTQIQRVGVTENGEMEAPNNAYEAGWFELGPRPGETGSAVVAGHLDGDSGEDGVFIDLNKLRKGDKLYVEDDNGETIVFAVRESRIYDAGYADEVFNQSGGVYLNLITCDGAWDKDKKSFSKRLVVFAEQVLDN